MYRKNGLKLINLFLGESKELTNQQSEILQLSNRIPVRPWYEHGRTYIPDKSITGGNLIENGAEAYYFLDSFFPISEDRHFIKRWGKVDLKVAMRDPKWKEYLSERAAWYAKPLFDVLRNKYGATVVLDTLAHNPWVEGSSPSGPKRKTPCNAGSFSFCILSSLALLPLFRILRNYSHVEIVGEDTLVIRIEDSTIC